LEPRSLLEYADELLALATEHGLGYDRMAALMWRGSSLAALGRADEGIPLLNAGIDGWRALGFVLLVPELLSLLGDACRMAAQWQVALRHLAEARRLAEETKARWFQAETLRITGEVLLATGDHAGAEAGYREAIAIAQHQSARLWELRAATGLAKLWRDHGNRAEAHALLAPVYDWFTEGFGTPVLQEARALLDELT
jgi:predicted ATPase